MVLSVLAAATRRCVRSALQGKICFSSFFSRSLLLLQLLLCLAVPGVSGKRGTSPPHRLWTLSASFNSSFGSPVGRNFSEATWTPFAALADLRGRNDASCSGVAKLLSSCPRLGGDSLCYHSAPAADGALAEQVAGAGTSDRIFRSISQANTPARGPPAVFAFLDVLGRASRVPLSSFRDFRRGVSETRSASRVGVEDMRQSGIEAACAAFSAASKRRQDHRSALHSVGRREAELGGEDVGETSGGVVFSSSVFPASFSALTSTPVPLIGASFAQRTSLFRDVESEVPQSSRLAVEDSNAKNAALGAASSSVTGRETFAKRGERGTAELERIHRRRERMWATAGQTPTASSAEAYRARPSADALRSAPASLRLRFFAGRISLASRRGLEARDPFDAQKEDGCDASLQGGREARPSFPVSVHPGKQRLGLAGLEMHAHHNRKRNKLGRPYGHRRCLLRNLCTELLRRGELTTTLTRAKECRRATDKLIMLAKEPSLHTYRQALGYLYDKRLTRQLFLEAPQRFAFRPHGFCRVQKLPFCRQGDNAQMARIELLD
ncbi:putative 50S ribosomal protein L17 [Toxoplasma gondii RUB]|uniref:Putative 50S ribosomal protein L17 n=1 Tax=Toxoplasma gondii RUB TaxID=935652 RepID=A0A086M776_TOXGO|nr:putative 50S ribosomal protein L17 [Toxoplasma gondii RUB]